MFAADQTWAQGVRGDTWWVDLNFCPVEFRANDDPAGTRFFELPETFRRPDSLVKSR